MRLSPRNRTSTARPRINRINGIAARTAALIVALLTVVVAGVAAVTASSTAQAQQPAVAPVTAAPMRAVSVIDMTAFNSAINARFAAAQRAEAMKVQGLRTKVVDFAKAQIGDRYSAGAAGPNRFDCSGLTRYVYKSVVGKELPHQSHAQYARVKKISKKQARPGDLVFFFRNGAHHVGIYIGGNKMVDAVGYGSGVRISPITGSWWGATYSGMGRVLPA